MHPSFVTRQALRAAVGGAWERPLRKLAERVEAVADVRRSPDPRATQWNMYCVPLVIYPSQAALPGPQEQ
ncbi:MAG: hypothetical protein ACKPKO_57260, partial [Candidatus Fonsibacter sp.]